MERLAFRAERPGEADLPGIWPDPLPVVLAALAAHAEWETLLANLPDLVVSSEDWAVASALSGLPGPHRFSSAGCMELFLVSD